MSDFCQNGTHPHPDVSFRAYVINLPEATERWNKLRANLENLEIPHKRVEGVQGEHLSHTQKQYNRALYNIAHGKRTNPRQIGCYLSHIKACQMFLESSDEYGLILEDDVSLPATTTTLIESTMPYSACWDVIRLSAHKLGKPLAFAELPDGHVLAYNLNVLKNTGAYLVNRHAARCICEKMLPMSLPYDVALDVEWRYGFKTAYISPLPMLINYDLPSQIPPAGKIRFFRSTTFHLFHGLRHIQRRFHRRRWFNQAAQMFPSAAQPV